MRKRVLTTAHKIIVELRHGNAPQLPPSQVVVDYDSRVVEFYEEDGNTISELIFFENIVKVKPLRKIDSKRAEELIDDTIDELEQVVLE